MAGLGVLAACAEFVTPTGNPAEREVRAIRVLPETLAVDDGDTTRLVATMFDQTGVAFTLLPAPAHLTWSSSAPAVVTVDSSGLVSGQRPGAAQVTAAVQGVQVPLSLSTQVVVRAVPTALAPAAGDSQSGVVGTPLPQSFLARVTDRHGSGVPGVRVAFAVTAGVGRLGADTVVTDTVGVAAAPFTLDTLAGANAVEARTARLPLAVALFHATGRAGAPSSLARTGGDAQTATVGAALPLPLAVRVADRYGNATPGVPVSFTVTAGRGALSAAVVNTDSAGQARVTLTLDTIAGPVAIDGSTPGLPAVRAHFTATARAGAATRFAVVSGDSQAGTTGAPLPVPLVARALDRYDNPVPGVAVAWDVVTGGGQVAPASGVSDSLGRASTTWTLGVPEGAQSARAAASGLPSATFTATAHAVVASVAVAPPTATVIAGRTQRFTATPRDAFGNALAGRTTTWTTSDTVVAVVDTTGLLSARAPGALTVTATVSGVAGTASVTVVPVPVAAVGVSPDTATLAAGLTRQFTATPRDSAGSPLAGRAITWSTSDTSVARVDTTGLVQGAHAGTATISAVAGGVAGTATVTVTPGVAARMVFTAQPPAAEALQLLTPAVVVTVRDAYGNTVPAWPDSVSLAFGANPGSATLGGTLRRAVASGVATFADLTVSTGGAGYTLVASSTGLPPDTSAAFTVTGTAYPMTIDVPGPDLIGLGLTNPLDITLSQPAGVGGVTVTLTTDAASLITAPGTLVIPQGATTGRITLSGLALGSTTVRATASGYATAALSVQVSDHVVATATDEISAHYYSACALRTGGGVFCWGQNTSGQAGPDNPGGSTLPRRAAPALTFVAVASGLTSCGLTASGATYCWGDNSSGQLGSGSASPATSASPVAVGAAPAFAKIAVGGSSVCGLTPAGGVYCWGDNALSQIGDGVPATPRLAPTLVAGGRTFKDLSLTGAHACALTTGGEAYCWGWNGSGQVGDGTTTNQPVPTAVGGGLRFESIAAGVLSTCAVTAAGAPYCWGDNSQGQLGDGTTTTSGAPVAVARGVSVFTSVAVGLFHACGIADGGTAWCWGQGVFGALGGGSFADHATPAPVSAGGAFRAMSAGYGFTCGVATSDQVRCWGADTYGQLGDGLTASRAFPFQITPGGPPSRLDFAVQPTRTEAGQVMTPAVQVSVEDGFGAPAGTPDTVVLWLYYQTSGPTNHYDQHGFAGVVNGVATFPNVTIGSAGTGYRFVLRLAPPGTSADLTPCGFGNPPTCGAPYLAQSAAFDVTVPLVVPPVPLSAGVAHACEIRFGGAVWCWGGNAAGQLGDGGTSDAALPVAASTGQSFVAVSAGDDHTCALTGTGAAWCWGGNAVGQLGTGDNSPSLTPTAVAGGLAFVQILAGGGFTCALTAAGSAYCWGGNGGKLGDDNPSSNPLSPQPVSGGLTFTALSLFGNNHACGLEVGGKAYCWGYNYDGEVGDGTQSDRYVPTAVAGFGTYAAIAAATFHSCALTAAGAAFCWGDNNVSQLGWGSPPTDQLSPGAVGGGYAFTSLAAGGGHTCGLQSSGAAICWGYNAEGALGDGTQTTRVAPAPVSGGLTFARLALGENFSCGQTSTGETWCWGVNTSGQLGDATHSRRIVPVQVGVSLAVATVEVTPGTASLTVGQVVPLAATTRSSGGGVLTGRIIAWTTSDSSIASVGANGLVMAFGPGSATVTATSEGVSSAATITVTAGGPSASAAALVSTGYVHTCAIRAGLHAWCWGFASSGYFNGAGYYPTYNVPRAVATTLQFTQISAGYDATCGLAVDSLAYCWGGGSGGQLGNGSPYNASYPVPVSGGFKFVQVRLGWRIACALTAGGAVYCWGVADGLIAGYSSTYFGYYTVYPAPKLVSLPEPVTTIGDLGNHVCALGASGAVYCWGLNDAGSIGSGTSWPPSQVAGAPSSIGIAVGEYMSCALGGAGDAWCWGYNNLFSLGRSTPGAENPVPGLVDGGRTFAAIYAGNDFGCGLQADGAAYCWGANSSGQLGTGDTLTAPAPVPVSGGLTFTALTLGENHACGVTSAGQLYCWGKNGSGQLGDATYTNRLTPTLIP